MKPHIALAADYVAGERGFHKLYVDYTRSVQKAGGVPVVMPSLEEDEDVLSILATVDGVIMTGGDDLDPRAYGRDAHERVRPMAQERQRADLRLLELAMVMEVPVLGICAGCQLINVALGGTLLQDIPSERPSEILHSSVDGHLQAMHDVSIVHGSRLAGIIGAEAIEVNSTHHQAVEEIGRNLVVSATAADGSIEAIEMPGAWVLGVQWHPERLHDRREHLALFEALVAASALS